MDGAQFFPQLPSESLKNDGKNTFLGEVMRKKKAFFCHSFLPVHTSAFIISIQSIQYIDIYV